LYKKILPHSLCTHGLGSSLSGLSNGRKLSTNGRRRLRRPMLLKKLSCPKKKKLDLQQQMTCGTNALAVFRRVFPPKHAQAHVGRLHTGDAATVEALMV